jgi:HPt (histidine-containing phosphotransfer) domain-containing protein
MTTPQEDFQKFLDEQRTEYRFALPGKIQEILACWKKVDAGGEIALPLQELCRMTHSLAGTAGTLGFRELGQAAKALELLLDAAGEQGPAISKALREEIVLALAALQDSLPAQAPGSS